MSMENMISKLIVVHLRSRKLTDSCLESAVF